MLGMPPAATRARELRLEAHAAVLLALRRATYRGLVPAILPFISVTARVASSAEEKATKAEPRCEEREGGGRGRVSDGGGLIFSREP